MGSTRVASGHWAHSPFADAPRLPPPGAQRSPNMGTPVSLEPRRAGVVSPVPGCAAVFLAEQGQRGVPCVLALSRAGVASPMPLLSCKAGVASTTSPLPCRASMWSLVPCRAGVMFPMSWCHAGPV